jgi:GNAT superfamily N-acetyltransferase
MIGPIRLRRPTRADAPAMSASITELCVADHRGDPTRLAAWLENKTPESIAGWIDAGRTRLLLAERGDALAAVGGWAPGSDPAEGRIALLYAAPAHRGAGAGRALLARMELELAASRRRVGRLESTRTAEAFYLAHGWRRDGSPRTGRGGER